MKLLIVSCLSLVIFVTVKCENKRLKEVFSWQEVDYEWKNEEQKKTALENKEFIPENNLPLGLDVWKDKLFITIPRWKSGVVSSLNYVNISDTNKSPALVPYPSFEANQLVENPDTPHITSVFRVRVDECDRLWVIDTGLADILGSPKVYSTPQILIYDLNNDTLIRSYTLKESDIKENTFFANIIVDTAKSDCENTFAYVPDLGGYGIVVYDFKNNDSWRVKHHYFHFDPLAGNYNVGGVNFQWTDGIFSLALTKPLEDGSKTVYFHALSSTKEFQVNSRVLQNKTGVDYYEFKVLGEKGENSQTTASFLDQESGILFYTQINKNGIGCWNTKKPFEIDNLDLVATDNDTMVFPNDLKVDHEHNVWVLSDKLPVFIYKNLSPKETNYRIFRASVSEAVEGTKCQG